MSPLLLGLSALLATGFTFLLHWGSFEWVNADPAATLGLSNDLVPMLETFSQIKPLRKSSSINKWTHQRVVGGDETEPGNFPWMARLVYKNKTMCTGSLITNDTILTAAHCLAWAKFKTESITVMLGENIITYKEHHKEKHKIDFFCVHPQYRPWSLVPPRNLTGPYDVAILRLKRQVKYNKYIRSVFTFRQDDLKPDYQKECLAMGYGAIEADFNSNGKLLRMVRSDRLHTLEVEEIKCQRKFVKSFNRTVTCYTSLKEYKHQSTEVTGMAGACRGDSGGPITCLDPFTNLWYQWGVYLGSNSKCGHLNGTYFAFDLWKRRKDIERMVRLQTNSTPGHCLNPHLISNNQLGYAC